MEKEYNIGRVMGLQLSIEPAFIVGTMILWFVLSGIGTFLLGLAFLQAAAGGLIATVLYWLSEIVHQFGHASAARSTGYPMLGIRLGTHLFLGASIYPEDEEPLPAKIHIRRALGGPFASFVFTAVAGVIAWLLYPVEGVLEWNVLFVFIVNFLVFTLGSFLPLGFTDGSTLLKWWRER